MEPDIGTLGTLVSVAQAIAAIDAAPLGPPVDAEVDLALLAHHAAPSLLARDVHADRDLPPFDKALVDGFALRAADVAGAGASSPSVDVSLRHAGEVAAGSTFAGTLGPGEALAIMTGAPLPAGADAVVPIERVRLAGDRVHVSEPVPVGRFIARAGADVRAGACVLTRGAALGPAQLAVLASVGVVRVPVVADPIAHVLVTGDELVDAADAPGPGQIRDANGPMLVALLRRLGALPRMSRAGDDRATLRAALDQAAAEADVLLVSGGMSMGNHDHVPGLLAELGFELHVRKVRIQPGKPLVFATRRRVAGPFEREGKLDVVFGLPGNPVSGFVCTLRFVARVLARLRGQMPSDGFVTATLASHLLANGPREFYQPATLAEGVATPLPWKGSADLFTLARADALLVRPEHDPARHAGEPVRLLPIPR